MPIHALEIREASGAVKSIRPGGRLSIGRTSKADWVFAHDELMSSLHFVVTFEGDVWEIADAQSSNGTFVNGKRIEHAMIDDDDQVVAGNSRFQMRLVSLSSANNLYTAPPVEDTIETDSAAEIAASPPKPPSPPPPPVSPPLPPPFPASRSSSPSTWKEPPTTWKEIPKRSELVRCDWLWLIPLDESDPPLTLARGAAFLYGPLPDPWDANALCGQVAFRWRKDRGQYWRIADDVEILLNGAAAPDGELKEGDVLSIASAVFTVRYDPPLQLPPEPVPATGAFDTDLGEQDSRSQLAPAELVPAELVEPVTQPSLKKLATGQASNAPTGSAQTVVLEGRVPEQDLIGYLLALSTLAPVWLMQLEPSSPMQLSVPFRVASNDAAWMLSVQASWPTSNYLVLFAGGSAENVFEELATLMQSSAPVKFTVEDVRRWLAESNLSSIQPSIQNLLFIDGPSSHWVFGGSQSSLPEVFQCLSGWASQ